MSKAKPISQDQYGQSVISYPDLLSFIAQALSHPVAPGTGGGIASNVNPTMAHQPPSGAGLVGLTDINAPHPPTSGGLLSGVPQAQASAGASTPPTLPKSNAASYAPSSSQDTSRGFLTHTVSAGDTLWGLAQQYTGSGNNWHKIQGHGLPTDPRTLQPGMVLHIPIANMKGSN